LQKGMASVMPTGHLINVGVYSGSRFLYYGLNLAIAFLA
jgi:hypothetical protein